MDNKNKLWDDHPSFEEAEKAWDQDALKLKDSHPLKILKSLPEIPGVTKETAKFLKWKSLKYIIGEDKNNLLKRYVLKKPIKHIMSYIRSIIKKKAYIRSGDFFFYGLKNMEQFHSLLKDSRVIVGFSYCQKPHECPSKRFTDQCIHDKNHPVCRQCPIGKIMHALPEEKVIPLIIPTIHYIGEKIFETLQKYPEENLTFIITACELTLKMFTDFGNMAGVKGVGVRLDGRICNTMKAFHLSENGIKPGLTMLLKETEKQFLQSISTLRNSKKPLS
ncbi:MAG: hypothetical protein KAR79_05665 [Simkaniaceae bacterium]|nr:hypothetical protein [Simkaniaceae bacterium]